MRATCHQWRATSAISVAKRYRTRLVGLASRRRFAALASFSYWFGGERFVHALRGCYSPSIRRGLFTIKTLNLIKPRGRAERLSVKGTPQEAARGVSTRHHPPTPCAFGSAHAARWLHGKGSLFGRVAAWPRAKGVDSKQKNTVISNDSISTSRVKGVDSKQPLWPRHAPGCAG